MSQTTNNLAAYIWSLADLLRGDFKQSQYGRIILPFTLLRRLECVLADTKQAVLKQVATVDLMKLPEEGQEKLLLRATKTPANPDGLKFYNTSPMDLSTLGESGIKANLEKYIQSFSRDAREIFDHFNFAEFIGLLNDANLLYKIVQKVRLTDLSPAAVSNHDMGMVFEELIRKFAESSNETAGEHSTPRDIVHLTTALVFSEDGDALTKEGLIRTIYDPTAGTGGFLSSGMEYVYEHNPNARMVAYGQELNPESYAICKADMLIKGQEVANIKLGNTLSNDHFYAEHFDYILSNPPFGADWKKIEGDIKNEHTLKGFNGRFGPGLPRVSDGSLLFLLHLISKMRDSSEGGSRIGIILNGSPLFSGGAGSGESEIRRYILEADLLEAIVALPTDMFYNTGIATYVWVLSNKKTAERKGKVQLINGVNLYGKMRKSLGSKRNEMSEADIREITRCFGEFAVVDARELDKPAEQKSNRGRQSANAKVEAPKTFAAKIFTNHQFGYRRLTIERPLRLSWQFSDERIETLRYESGALNAAMKWVYAEYGATHWQDSTSSADYGQLADYEAEIRAHLKTHFADLKEKQIKDLLDPGTWLAQRSLLNKARALQAIIGSAQFDDFNQYDNQLEGALKTAKLALDSKEKKQFENAVSWKNPAAEKVIKKVHRTAAKPLYGLFAFGNQVIEYVADGDLRDFENVALDPSRSVNEINEAYFIKEVQPHVPDAWIDASKTDDKDGQIGVVGYEIPFKRNFNQKERQLWKEFRYYFQESRHEWLFALKKTNLRSVQFNEGSQMFDNTENIDFLFFKTKKIFDREYLRHFFSSKGWTSWLDENSNGATTNSISTYQLLRSKIKFPSINNQKLISAVLENANSWRVKLNLIEDEIWTASDKDFRLEFLPHPSEVDASSKLLEITPYPISSMLHHYYSIDEENHKDRFELLLKTIECFAIFISAYLLGAIESSEPKFAAELLKSQKRYLKNSSFGAWVELIKEVKKNKERYNLNPDDLFLEKIFSQELISKLEQSANFRNETTGHGSFPTTGEARNNHRQLEQIFEVIKTYFFELFDNHTLIRPINATFDGKKHQIRCDEFSGLGANPYGSKKIEIEHPLITNELYLISSQSDSSAVRLYPFIKILDIGENQNSGVESFYFFNKKNGNNSSPSLFLYISHQQITKQKLLLESKELEALLK